MAKPLSDYVFTYNLHLVHMSKLTYQNKGSKIKQLLQIILCLLWEIPRKVFLSVPKCKLFLEFPCLPGCFCRSKDLCKRRKKGRQRDGDRKFSAFLILAFSIQGTLLKISLPFDSFFLASVLCLFLFPQLSLHWPLNRDECIQEGQMDFVWHSEGQG